MVRTVRLSRNGSSLTIAVPVPVLQELGWRRGDILAVGPQDGRLVARRVEERELLDGRAAGAREALAARATGK